MAPTVRVEDRPPEGYRPCVGVMLIGRPGLVFAGRRVDAGDDPLAGWQMPQGGIEPGETPEEAARRELLEEVGTDRAALLAASRHWLAYDFPPELQGRVWRGRWRGQAQRWVAFRFTGEEADIRIDGPHREFAAWRWMPVEELLRCIVPFKRAVYRRVAAEFRHLWA